MTDDKNVISDNQIFKPQILRWFFYHWVFNLTAMLLGGSIALLLTNRGDFSVSWIIGALVGITVVTIYFSLHTERFEITISDGDIEGPGKNARKTVKFQIDQIDRSRSFKRTLFGKLFGFDHIYSTTGQKIYVESVSFGKDQVDLLRSKLKV